MWLFTVHGFFSVVRYEGHIAIRARDRQHLLNLLKLVDVSQPQILAFAGTDYPYRIMVTMREWEQVAADLADGVQDVSNFKNAAAGMRWHGAAKYLRVLHDTWAYLEATYRVNKNRKR